MIRGGTSNELSSHLGTVAMLLGPVHTYPMVSGFTLVPKAPLHQIVFRACAVERDSGGKFFPTLCRHICLFFGERLDTLFTSSDLKKYPDSPVHTLSDSLRIYFFPLWSRPHVIGFVADIFFSTLRIRCQIHRIRVDGSRIRKEKVADSKISGYVWTGP